MTAPLLSIVSILLLAAHPAFALEEAPQPANRSPGPPPGMEMQGPQLTAEQEIKEYLTLDKNGDGNLSKDELAARFQSLITRADSNNDGIVSSEELAQMVNRRFTAKAKHGGGRGGPGGPPPGGMPRRDDPAIRPEPRPDTP